MNSEKLYWSPGVDFVVSGESLHIGRLDFAYGTELFPQYYYLTRGGIEKEKLFAAFAHRKTAVSLTRQLLRAGVLINGLPGLKEFFYGLHPYTDTLQNEALFLDEAQFTAYQTEVSLRCVKRSECGADILLPEAEVPSFFQNHETIRCFDEQRVLDLKTLSGFLSVFRARLDRKASRYYPSAGGLYPIDLYLFVKSGRVEGLAEGMYYYHPGTHVLSALECETITEELHYITNRDIFRSSAVSLYLVYHGAANLYKYGFQGYAYGLLDTGIMAEAAYLAGQSLGLGLCSIGDMHFDRLGKLLQLRADEVPFHAMEIGWRPIDRKE